MRHWIHAWSCVGLIKRCVLCSSWYWFLVLDETGSHACWVLRSCLVVMVISVSVHFINLRFHFTVAGLVFNLDEPQGGWPTMCECRRQRMIAMEKQRKPLWGVSFVAVHKRGRIEYNTSGKTSCQFLKLKADHIDWRPMLTIKFCTPIQGTAVN